MKWTVIDSSPFMLLLGFFRTRFHLLFLQSQKPKVLACQISNNSNIQLPFSSYDCTPTSNSMGAHIKQTGERSFSQNVWRKFAFSLFSDKCLRANQLKLLTASCFAFDVSVALYAELKKRLLCRLQLLHLRMRVRVIASDPLNNLPEILLHF